MTLKELPTEIKEQILKEYEAMQDVNTSYDMLLHDKYHTRYFRATRCCIPWSDDKGNYMRFGGGTYWHITYGCIGFRQTRNCMGQIEYHASYNRKTFSKSANGTIIPKRLDTKKEVIALAKAIGIFNI